MSDYIKQLEDQNEELKQKLSETEILFIPKWTFYDRGRDQSLYELGNCTLAQVYSHENTWSACAYNCTEPMTEMLRENGFMTEQEAKKWAEETIHNKERKIKF